VIDTRRVLAIVPARAGSKGLPGKNIRPLHGKPLLAWPIEAARGSRYVDRVVVSTEDASLRPAELASDTAPSIGFLLHAIDTLAAAGENYEFVVLLEPTSPLTQAVDVDAALEQLIASEDVADAIVGVVPMETTHPSFAVRRDDAGVIRPLLSDSFGALPRRQDLEPVFALDGSLYISTIDALKREQGFAHARTLGYVTDRIKGLEIDDLVDFLCVEAVMEHRKASAGDDNGPTDATVENPRITDA
jgi:N-acylneuraminate cytidylyltransferase/CMP-N,N'-diacetyllegionaminic acid synthase